MQFVTEDTQLEGGFWDDNKTQIMVISGVKYALLYGHYGRHGRCCREFIHENRFNLTMHTKYVITREIAEHLLTNPDIAERREWMRTGNILYSEMHNEDQAKVRSSVLFLTRKPDHHFPFKVYQ